MPHPGPAPTALPPFLALLAGLALLVGVGLQAMHANMRAPKRANLRAVRAATFGKLVANLDPLASEAVHLAALVAGRRVCKVAMLPRRPLLRAEMQAVREELLIVRFPYLPRLPK